MSAPIITPQGIQIQTFNQIRSELEQLFKDIYGMEIVLDQSTQDGQVIDIISKMALDLQAAVFGMQNRMDIDFAQGEDLNRLMKMVGVIRRPATQSLVDLEIITNRSVNLAAGFTVSDDNGVLWVTDDDYTLITGSNTVTARSKDFGRFDAPSNTVNKITTAVIGVISANNPQSAIAGRNEETDEELRQRISRSRETSGKSTIGTLYSQLLGLDSVTDLQIYENMTSSYDLVRDIPAHSYWVIIEGGDQADIIKTIAIDKTGGTGLKGLITGTYLENFELNGISKTIPHDVKFDRPAYSDIYLRVVVQPVSSGFVDNELIINKLSAKNFLIAESAIASNYYCDIYSTQPNIKAFNLEISRDGITWEQILTADYDEKFKLPSENITVSQVVFP